ncbi:MAG: hypothetical protein ABSA18_15340 [Dehalococcoidia bacterium]|jgi:Co/Zn/Cd efflux system component
MSDKIFEVSLCALAALTLVWIVGGIALAAMGYPWADVCIGLLIFLTILMGIVVLIVGGGALLYFWGKNYTARG